VAAIDAERWEIYSVSVGDTNRFLKDHSSQFSRRLALTMTDLIFISMENWDEIWRRNQFVCAELARRYPEMKILFVGLARDVSNDLRHGRIPFSKKPATWRVPGLQNIVVTRPLKLLPNSIGLGRAINEKLVRDHVGSAAEEMGIREPVLWLNPHYALHMAGRMRERAVVYDITDDWVNLTQRCKLRDLTREQDAELCRRADATIVCSERLFELKRELATDLNLIPNGVDAEHYRKVLDGMGPLPSAASGWTKPVLGYTGTIHPDRVDVGLVVALARRMTDASIVLVGPSHLSKQDTSLLQACGNVFMPGPVPYQEIPSYMRAFDVCITPHRVTLFTESLNPIKLWEYLAGGKPIVSTDVAGFREYPQFVRIGRTAEEFESAAREALVEGPAIGEARRAEARRHSWSARVDQIEAVIESCLERRTVGDLVHA
jgi:glycosyltransferase involved in cell wall biosynthesis